MNLSEREKLELLGRIGAAFWSVFPEADRVRTPAFEAEMRVFFVRIVADQEKIGELGASADGYDRLMVDMLRGRVGALLNELVASIEHRGAYADRKIYAVSGARISDLRGRLPGAPGSRGKVDHGPCFAPGSRKLACRPARSRALKSSRFFLLRSRFFLRHSTQ